MQGKGSFDTIETTGYTKKYRKEMNVMTALRQEAYQLLDEFDESEMTSVVTLLRNYKLLTKESQSAEEGLEGLRIIESFAGRLPNDFNEKEELEKGLEEKHAFRANKISHQGPVSQ